MATALATVGAVSAAGMAPRVRRGTAAKLNAGRAFREGETSTCGLRGKRAGARRAARVAARAEAISDPVEEMDAKAEEVCGARTRAWRRPVARARRATRIL